MQSNNLLDLTGKILRSQRALCHISQIELGRLIGRSQTWISFVESEKTLPQREEAEKLAAILREKLGGLE